MNDWIRGFNSSAGNRLIARLAKAGWITGINKSAPDNFHLTLTDYGERRLRKALTLWRTVLPAIMPGERSRIPCKSELESLPNLFRVFDEVSKLAASLQPPKLTNRERDILNGLILVYAIHGRPEGGMDETFDL